MKRLGLAFVLFGLTCSAEARDSARGVARWPIKTSIPAHAPRQSVSLADLITLPDPPDAANKSKAHQSLRYSRGQNAHGLAEGDVVTTTGWIFLVAGEDDGDYHVQISASPKNGDHCLIVEIPSGDPKFVDSAAVRAKSKTVRDFIRVKLLRGREPSANGAVMIHPVFVEITGQLFFDDAHLGEAPRGKKGMRAATLWELHPVTAIRFAPKPPQ